MLRILPILALLLPSTLCAQQTAVSPRSAGTPVYHTAHYQQGGSIRVLRYWESGTMASQAQAARMPGAHASASNEDLYTGRHYTLRREAQLVQFRLVSTPRYHFAQSTYRTQDNGTAIVLRVVAEHPAPLTETAAATTSSGTMARKETRVYPNPVSTPGIISLEVPEGEGYTFRLLDLNGRVVHTEALPAATWSVRLEHLAPGVYVYTVENGAFRQSGRLVVQ
ncbi:MAG: T9SS type A sorting domain-containing protein [Bacteroidetes bacterium]|nr:T9SS type A sorting domain-containing protein [Bacteroidota bacterium]